MEALKPYTYLIINVFTILCPLVLGNDKARPFNTQWRSVLPGIGLVGAAFIAWDVWFVRDGVWGFNPDYITGVRVFNLPLEEVLFFVTVPYACMFIYVLMRFRFGLFHWYHAGLPMTFLALGLIATGLVMNERLYTAVNFVWCGVTILVHRAVFRKKWIGVFVIAYLVHLVPFFVINGVLTSLPVVWYNDAENLAFRLFTIPFEDLFYSLALLLGNVTVYEVLKSRQSKAKRVRAMPVEIFDQ